MKGTDCGPSTETALIEGRKAFLGFLAKRLGNRSEAEDVLQDFCIRVLARKDQLRDVERMNAWLYAVLRSALNDHYRKASRRRHLAETVAAEPEGWTEDATGQLSRLCRCSAGLLPELRPTDADLIRRIDLQEDDRATVAADLGLTRGTLAVRLHRARTALKDSLLSHCGPCCETDRDDCFCPPAGCENHALHSNCREDAAVM
ncbi:RNA polymerase sigma factor [Nioella nitratireducens]|uniref:RNA polymerase sigma factor n=1 Tax=Nioella nitratireducens TaxID=1287720 RepID=UPI001F23D249|nr:sigma-70 family RNA polymerase sigma factor [Nioella nitratireducens]